MRKIVFSILMLIAANSLCAQHVQYRDKPKDKLPSLPKPKPPVVYHDWPDKCPALSGAVPVLTNYVPKEIMLKVREIYEGHLYSITSMKTATGKFEYKLKVCDKGSIHYHYADENGIVVRKD